MPAALLPPALPLRQLLARPLRRPVHPAEARRAGCAQVVASAAGEADPAAGALVRCSAALRLYRSGSCAVVVVWNSIGWSHFMLVQVGHSTASARGLGWLHACEH